MNGILELTLNGEVKQLKFSNYALETYTKISGSDIGNIKEIGEDYSQLQMVADLVFSGLTGYYRGKSLIIDFTYEDVVEWVDDLSYEGQLQVIKCFTESCLKITQEMIKAFKAMSNEQQGEKKVTWDDILDCAVMDLGLLPHIFWDMTFVDYYRYFIYKRKQDANEWDRTRTLMSYVLNTQVEKKHQKKPREILPLWTDILSRLNKKITITTQKDKEAILEKLKPKENGK